MPTQFREKKFEKMLERILPMGNLSKSIKIEKNPLPPVNGKIETPEELNRRQNGNFKIKGF